MKGFHIFESGIRAWVPVHPVKLAELITSPMHGCRSPPWGMDMVFKSGLLYCSLVLEFAVCERKFGRMSCKEMSTHVLQQETSVVTVSNEQGPIHSENLDANVGE